jgi:iron complex outermembrane receptor protein
LQGGTVGLRPEAARIYTVGIVYSPQWAPGTLTLSADYYGIYQKNLVLAGDPNFVLSQFFAGNAAFQRLVTFNPNGTLNTVNTISFNVASRDVEGLDLGLIYQTPEFNWGQLTLTTDWNYTFKYQVTTAPGQPPTVFLGRFVDPGVGGLAPGAIPYWKGFVDLNYGIGGFNAGVKFNYIGEYADDPAAIAVNPPERKVESYYTFDLRTSYEFKEPQEVTPDNAYTKDGRSKPVVAWSSPAKPGLWATLLGGARVQVGINNVFDREPPFVAGASSDNQYDPSLYTIRGRTWYVSLTKKF